MDEAGGSVSPQGNPRWEPYSASPSAPAPNPPAGGEAGAGGQRGPAAWAGDPLAALEAALATHGPAAQRAAHAELVALERPADMGTNALSWLGGRVSWHLRRAVLLDALRAHAWNLTAVAGALGMSGAGNVTKAIGDLGLNDELGEARTRGLAKRGHKRTKGGAK